MTNLVAEIVVTLTLVTNWTGLNHGTNELGYVATKHTATVPYRVVRKYRVVRNYNAPPEQVCATIPFQNLILIRSPNRDVRWHGLQFELMRLSFVGYVNPHDNYLFQTNLNVENFP